MLVVPSERVGWAREQTRARSDVEVVAAGEVRQESVANGLEKVSSSTVLIHDAARPFIDRGVLDALVDALARYDAAIPAVPVDETVKETNGSSVVRTVDRSQLVLSQTPQAFHTVTLRRVHERARTDGYTSADDAELIERYGGTVGVVPGSRNNIKLTYPEDFALAEALISS